MPKGKLSERGVDPAELTNDLNVIELASLVTPIDLKRDLPLTPTAAGTVVRGREAIRHALAGEDHRILVVVGPCSIHDPKAALEYASRLARLSEDIEDQILIVMRVYFEKPRTTVGWKGLINDPNLDGSEDINAGLRRARELLLAINELGLPCATEFLDPIVPQYIAELVSWAAIGARTTESQTHREMASGLSMPVGFKNSTDGDLQNALDAMVSARHAHSFLGITTYGLSAIVRTRGNRDVHLVLRGGGGKPNYSPAHIAYARTAIAAGPKYRPILVDCSHGNSNKDYRLQPKVFENLIAQRLAGETALLGMMLESHLNDGNQKKVDGTPLRYGVSITDGCLGWEPTEALLREAHRQLSAR